MRVAEILTKYGYVQQTRMKTQTLQRSDTKTAKIYFQLTKTPEFESLHKKFQEEMNSRKKEKEHEEEEAQSVPEQQLKDSSVAVEQQSDEESEKASVENNETRDGEADWVPATWTLMSEP